MHFSARTRTHHTVVAAFLVFLFVLIGCAPAPPAAQQAPSPVAEQAPPPAAVDSTPEPLEELSAEPTVVVSLVELANTQRETWDVVSLQGARVGYGHVRFSLAGTKDEPRIRIDGEHRLSMQRFGQANEQQMNLSTVESPDGGLLEFRSETVAGPAPLIVSGRVDGNELIVERGTGPQATTKRIAWSADHGGFFATELSLLRQPLAPGERRELKALMPMFDDVLVADILLTAHDFEAIELPQGSRRLLRASCT